MAAQRDQPADGRSFNRRNGVSTKRYDAHVATAVPPTITTTRTIGDHAASWATAKIGVCQR